MVDESVDSKLAGPLGLVDGQTDFQGDFGKPRLFSLLLFWDRALFISLVLQLNTFRAYFRHRSLWQVRHLSVSTGEVI
jgi:hypothetical protein